MGLGISKFLIKLNAILNCCIFNLRVKTLGFENANAFLRSVDKNSLMPILKKNGARIGENCDIEAPVIFHNCLDYSNLVIGNSCHIGKNCFFDLRDKVIINDNAVISMQSSFITHIDLGYSELHYLFPANHAPIVIKKNVFIGANTTILKGVTIDEGSFIAAGSVVNKNILPFTMVGGVPAKFIKKLN
jgi:acetyltransferase-like isoleucine patch superfamily enzyme